MGDLDRRIECGSSYITELNGSCLSQLRDGRVRRLWLDEDLAQGHLLTPEHGAHRAAGCLQLFNVNNWKGGRISGLIKNSTVDDR